MKNEIEEPKIGGHYYDTESLNYLYCYTSLMVVLDKSEKARELFEEVKQCWDLPGCKQLIERVLSKTQNTEKFALDLFRAAGLNPKEDRTFNLKDTKAAVPGISDKEEYIRWCGRGRGLMPPPTRIQGCRLQS